MKSVFPSGARVLVDGEREAIVRQAFPEGSTSFFFPHYKVDFCNVGPERRWSAGDRARIEDGDTNVAVAMHRVGVERKKPCP